MDYQFLWDHMIIKPEMVAQVKETASKILIFKDRYEEVAEMVGCPWYFIGPIHYRESSLSFRRHLHNGDPLIDRTIHVPKGRPEKGIPPFTWEESAVDALLLRGVDKIKSWTMPVLLEEFELYNGLGYQKYHPSVKSPYLWSGSSYYGKGKYSSDGHFDPELVDKQIGCAPLLRYITDKTLWP